MRALAVVVGEEGPEPFGPMCAAGACIGPLPQAGLNESLGLAVGLRTVGLCKAVLDAQRLAGTSEHARAVIARV